MLRGFYTSGSGMMSRKQQLNITSNNLSNASTPGFKKDVAVFKPYPSQDLSRTNDKVQDLPGDLSSVIDARPRIGPMNTGVQSDGTYKDQAQGSLNKTGNELDLAIQGKGHFTVSRANGEPAYTRNGSFKLDSSGRLVTSKGRPVLGENGPIQLDVSENDIYVAGNGQIKNANGEVLGQLRVEQFENPVKMKKLGDSLLRQGENNPVIEEPQDFKVRQGFLEASNTEPIQSLVKMMETSRQYTMNQRILRRQDQMLQQATTRVGRV